MPQPIVLLLALGTATAAPLRLDPHDPPQLLAGDRYAFPRPGGGWAELTVLPALVLHLEPGVAPPAGAESLGGRSWRLELDSPALALAMALDWTSRPGVSAFPDLVLPLRPAGSPTPGEDDPGRGGQWYLDELQYDVLLRYSTGNASTRVAVIDSGIDIGHVDLAAAVDAPYDAWDDDADPSPNPGEYCQEAGSTEICDEHGTAVSGIIAARADNGAGIAGMCPDCRLIPIKLLGEGSGTNTLSADIRAFEHAIAQDVAVINNSWGFTESIPCPDTLAEVIHRAAIEPRDGLGALVVFAAGNDDRVIEEDELQALPDVLCVSAVDSYGAPTNYTNTGATVDVSAPSATVTIAPGDQMTTSFGGTSAAAPVASGLASWAASVAPELSSVELMELLVSTARQSPSITPDEDGHHDTYGYGIIDALAVMDALVGQAGGGDTGGEEVGGCGCQSGSAPALGAGLAGLVGALIGRRRRR